MPAGETAEGPTPLETILRRMIELDGPIPIDRYMELCLGHPEAGYYTTRDPFGEAGDFTTAPEISQMFGELIGLWCARVWTTMESPRFTLVEMGPGRGTLMADLLRAAAKVPGFIDAASVALVENSPVLRQRQSESLTAHRDAIRWYDRIEDVPDGPAIIVANEFLDALPVRQFERTEGGWCERMVGTSDDGSLKLGLMPSPVPEAILLPACRRRVARQRHRGFPGRRRGDSRLGPTPLHFRRRGSPHRLRTRNARRRRDAAGRPGPPLYRHSGPARRMRSHGSCRLCCGFPDGDCKRCGCARPRHPGRISERAGHPHPRRHAEGRACAGPAGRYRPRCQTVDGTR